LFWPLLKGQGIAVKEYVASTHTISPVRTSVRSSGILFGDCDARTQGHFFDLSGTTPEDRRMFALVYRKRFGFNKPDNVTSWLEAHFPSAQNHSPQTSYFNSSAVAAEG
jgi:hypothetical protein